MARTPRVLKTNWAVPTGAREDELGGPDRGPEDELGGPDRGSEDELGGPR